MRSFVPIGVIVLLSGGLALIVSYLWHRQENTENSSTSDFPTLEDDWVVENLHWGNDQRNGLGLNFVNSMSLDWHEFFDEAVEDWDAAPSLFLTTSQDGLLSCNHLRGKIRVCNDEFGDTGWLGINEAIYYEYGDGKENIIVSSVAKINESYLREASDSQKQYVVCHEIGHAFALAHRYEEGSCLIATTQKFSLNMRPDSVDFEKLQNLYGVFDTNRNRRRNMRSKHDEINEEIATSFRWNYRNGRLLHQSTYQEIYETQLGDGLKVMTLLLLHKTGEGVVVFKNILQTIEIAFKMQT
jgi:hypothetical protein